MSHCQPLVIVEVLWCPLQGTAIPHSPLQEKMFSWACVTLLNQLHVTLHSQPPVIPHEAPNLPLVPVWTLCKVGTSQYTQALLHSTSVKTLCPLLTLHLHTTRLLRSILDSTHPSNTIRRSHSEIQCNWLRGTRHPRSHHSTPRDSLQSTPRSLQSHSPREQEPTSPAKRNEVPPIAIPQLPYEAPLAEYTYDGPYESSPDSTPRTATSSGVTPREVTPREATPTPSTPREVTPREKTSSGVTPREVSPREVTPVESTPREVTPRETTPREVTPREVAPREVAPREVTPREVIINFHTILLFLPSFLFLSFFVFCLSLT